jgi:3D (Asp-Asp-Asp) domain-containing protein
MRYLALAGVAIVLAFGCSQCARAPRPVPSDTAARPPAPRPETAIFEVTAYSIEGRTAKGTRAREGVVAADPEVLPLGSRVRLVDADQYSGEYVVEDTGRAIKGRELDVYLASDAEAKRFGRRKVTVEILERGH